MSSLTGPSKLLSYVLRHHPENVGVTLDDGGWIDVDTLLAALARHGKPISRETLDAIVAGTPAPEVARPTAGEGKESKRRFEIVDGRIRAAQGHSIDVDLGLPAVPPPPVLFHGTVEAFLPAILAEGLTPRSRRHVHLSIDIATASAVGARRGRPVILTVDAAGMHADGYVFHVAANGVWLTSSVPPRYLTRPG